MTANSKTVIIGLDGVPLGMLKEFAEDGTMPNIRRVIDGGCLIPMRSSIPEISSVAWSSIITGTGPGEHGIFGFIDMRPASYKMKFPNFGDLKAPPFWDISEGRSVIINVPSTYPVREMNGVHISGFVSIDFAKSIHPKSLVPLLDSMDYRLDVDAQKAHESIDDFLEDLDQTLDARIEAYRYLWDNQEWQTFMLVFTGTDRLMHFLWDAYDDKDHKHHDSFVRHFRKIDEAIGEIVGKMDDGDQLIMLSDHGFERLEKDVYINHLLANEGFLTLDPDAEPGLAGISSATKAFALDPGRIFINERGKYPAGSVAPADTDACLKDLEDLFSSLQVDGRRVIKYIHKKQDVYSGPYLDDAADLILVAEKGFNLKGRISSEELFSKGPFTGKHTYPDAFLLLADGDLADGLPDNASVTDAGKMIQNLVKRQ